MISNMELNLDGTMCMQQRQVGPGVLDGTAVAYAVRQLTTGGATLTVRARQHGTEGNTLHVALISSVPTVNATTRVVRVSEGHYEVFLRGDASAPLALGAEVASVINAAKLPIVAAVTGTDEALAAAADAALSGGLDYVLDRGIYRLREEDATSMGMFFFENTEPLVVFQIEGQFDGAGDVEVLQSNVDFGLTPIDGEEVRVYKGALNDAFNFQMLNVRLILMPGQALRVNTGQPGTARVYACRMPRQFTV